MISASSWRDKKMSLEGFRDYLSCFTMTRLKDFHLSLLGTNPEKGNKRTLVSAILDLLSFGDDEERFLAWFSGLPEYLAAALEKTAFGGHISVSDLQKLCDIPVLGEDSLPNPRLRLAIFLVYRDYGKELLYLRKPFPQILRDWLPGPAGYSLFPILQEEHRGWELTSTFRESMPLLLEKIGAIAGEPSKRNRLVRRGLNKTEIKELRRSCAFPAFPESGSWGADPIDLLARFTMIDPKRFIYTRDKDVRDHIQYMVRTFLEKPAADKAISPYRLIGSNFEYSALAVHLKKKPGAGRNMRLTPMPPSRILFRQIADFLAANDTWFNPKDGARALKLQSLPFSFSTYGGMLHELALKGEELHLPEGTFRSRQREEGFSPDFLLHHALVVEPLLKGYCCLMAALGIFEIAESEPEKPLLRRGRACAISPFDAVTHARITPFGAWCMGAAAEKPGLGAVEYEVAVDGKLPLVTLRGSSLECRAYLELVGDPLGEERFRISEGSFVKGCRSLAEIESRIADFLRLICREPEQHWLELFAGIRERSRLFRKAEECLMFRLPPEREVLRIFTDDQKVSRLVTRAEGGCIVVKKKDYRKLRKVLEAHGCIMPADL
jgi:hypothetical protein